jgi:hypothetical protein
VYNRQPLFVLDSASPFGDVDVTLICASALCLFFSSSQKRQTILVILYVNGQAIGVAMKIGLLRRGTWSDVPMA